MTRRATYVASALGGLLAAVLASGCGVLPGEHATERAAAVDGPSVPAPPAGSRWVGADGVMVAVPDWWSTGETQCGAPVEDTVYFDAAATYDCVDPVDPATVAEVSALAVLDATCCYGEWKRRSMEPVAGSPAVELAGCDRWFEGVCRRLFALPGSDVVLAVTIDEEGDGSYATIRDSVRRVPDGMTSVPLRVGGGFTPAFGTEPALARETVRTFERAGLVVVVERPARRGADDAMVADLPRGSVLGIEPAPGSLVRQGATVTVTLAR